MRRQAKKVGTLSTHMQRTRPSSEQKLRKYELVKKNEYVDISMECENQMDSSSSLKSLRKAKKSHKKKSAVREVRKTSPKDAAHVYLQLWHTDRRGWRFRKKIQFWLLKNMYSKDEVSKEDFKILLLYLEDLKGSQRERKIDEAQIILDTYEQQEDEGQSSAIARRRYKRAIEVLRVLA